MKHLSIGNILIPALIELNSRNEKGVPNMRAGNRVATGNGDLPVGRQGVKWRLATPSVTDREP